MYFPLGLKRNDLPTRSFGAPSNPLSAAVTELEAYGLALDSVDITGVVDAGGGVGAFRMFACETSGKRCSMKGNMKEIDVGLP